MSDEVRASERQRRELAQQHAGEVVQGSGRPATPRRMGQMVSLRLEPDLAAALRELAASRGTSVSDLLREAATLLLSSEEDERPSRVTWHVVGGTMPPVARPVTGQRQ
jgi:hypothetical protein